MNEVYKNSLSLILVLIVSCILESSLRTIRWAYQVYVFLNGSNKFFVNIGYYILDIIPLSLSYPWFTQPATVAKHVAHLLVVGEVIGSNLDLTPCHN